MSSLVDVSSLLAEIRTILKSGARSQASGQSVPERFVIGSGAPGTNQFSLPSSCYAVDLVGVGAFSYMFSSQASINAIPVAAATKHEIRNGPLDLSTFHVFVAAAASGNTITAWVQRHQG